MVIRKKFLVGIVILGIFCFSVSPSMAELKYSPLSDKHTTYGYSQFLASTMGGDGDYVKLYNPTSVTMVVAILVYDRESGGSGSGGSTYLGYRVVKMLPHTAGSYNYMDAGTTSSSDLGSTYIEIIACPETPVNLGAKSTRMANGLGINGGGGGYGGPLGLIHPSLFRLPFDDVVEGQRQQASNDIIAGLAAVAGGAPADTFAVFGIPITGPQPDMKVKRFSSSHTLYGVSQYISGYTSGYEYYLKLSNPTPVTMIVAVLAYDRESGGSGGGGSEFVDYNVIRLAPHAAASVGGVDTDFGQRGIEIISAPETPPSSSMWGYRRTADGLGIIKTRGGYGGDTFSGNPNAFNLPSDAVVAGQRQEAINSILCGLEDIGAPLDTFKDFGIEGECVPAEAP
ncbi:hypothetical protein OAC89_04360 [Deltaproteobacteria bacterium]|nr:hypothetical protein [Deltaproteobacteria bacterium]